MNPIGLPIVGYCRVSTDRQEASIPEQIQWLNDLAKRQTHDLIHVFQDEAMKGYDKDRPGFIDLLSFCESRLKEGKPIRALATYVLSRFSRSDALTTARHYDRLRDAGVRWLITSAKVYDLHSTTDHVILAIEQSGESSFSPTLARNSTRSVYARVKAGQPVGCPPYGFLSVYDRGDRGKSKPIGYRIDDFEAEVVRRIFKMYTEGEHSLRSITTQLNAEQIPPPSVAKKRKNAAKCWTAATVRQILVREAYIGTRLWNQTSAGAFVAVVNGEVTARTPEEVEQLRTAKNRNGGPIKRIPARRNQDEDVIRIPDAYPAIIEVEVFKKTQARLKERKEKPIRCEGRLRTYIFTGLLLCGKCGSVMAGTAKQPPGKDPYAVYVCGRYAAGGKSACDCNWIREDLLLNGLAKVLRERFTPALVEELRQTIRRQLALPDPSDAEIKRLKKQLHKVQGEFETIARNVLTRVTDDYLFETGKKILREQVEVRSHICKRLADLEMKKSNPSTEDVDALVNKAADAVNRLEEVFTTGKREDVRQFLRDNIQSISVLFKPT